MCDGTAWGGRKLLASGASLGWVQKALYELGQDTHRVPGVEETLGHLLVG